VAWIASLDSISYKSCKQLLVELEQRVFQIGISLGK